jgi:hypothetical protein
MSCWWFEPTALAARLMHTPSWLCPVYNAFKCANLYLPCVGRRASWSRCLHSSVFRTTSAIEGTARRGFSPCLVVNRRGFFFKRFEPIFLLNFGFCAERGHKRGMESGAEKYGLRSRSINHFPSFAVTSRLINPSLTYYEAKSNYS